MPVRVAGKCQHAQDLLLLEPELRTPLGKHTDLQPANMCHPTGTNAAAPC